LIDSLKALKFFLIAGAFQRLDIHQRVSLIRGHVAGVPCGWGLSVRSFLLPGSIGYGFVNLIFRGKIFSMALPDDFRSLPAEGAAAPENWTERRMNVQKIVKSG